MTHEDAALHELRLFGLQLASAPRRLPDGVEVTPSRADLYELAIALRDRVLPHDFAALPRDEAQRRVAALVEALTDPWWQRELSHFETRQANRLDHS